MLVPNSGNAYILLMNVIARRTLRTFWEIQPQAEGPVKVWYAMVSKAEWNGPADVKEQFGASVDFVGDNRVIFDIAGNKYRIVIHVAYRFKRVLVKFIGTHKEYDKINAESV
jgi:mRNA interferase HigB